MDKKQTNMKDIFYKFSGGSAGGDVCGVCAVSVSRQNKLELCLILVSLSLSRCLS